MIRLDRRTRQDFLDRKWSGMVREAGVEMQDAKYCIVTAEDGEDYIILIEEYNPEKHRGMVPTYSLSELFYKLNEWPSIKLGEDTYIGAELVIYKDAPFYGACYYFSKTEENEEYKKYDYQCLSEYPIESFTELLICSAKSNFYNFKYSTDISGK